LHFAEAEILKANNSPDLDHFILTDSGVAADNAFDLLRVSGKWCTYESGVLVILDLGVPCKTLSPELLSTNALVGCFSLLIAQLQCINSTFLEKNKVLPKTRLDKTTEGRP